MQANEYYTKTRQFHDSVPTINEAPKLDTSMDHEIVKNDMDKDLINDGDKEIETA